MASGHGGSRVCPCFNFRVAMIRSQPMSRGENSPQCIVGYGGVWDAEPWRWTIFHAPSICLRTKVRRWRAVPAPNSKVTIAKLSNCSTNSSCGEIGARVPVGRGGYRSKTPLNACSIAVLPRILPAGAAAEGGKKTVAFSAKYAMNTAKSRFPNAERKSLITRRASSGCA